MDDVQDTVDIPTAAGRMGITPEAVRKRIARGTLPATKQDGRWYVVLDGQDGQGPASWTGRPTPDGIDSVQDAVQDDKDKLIEVLQAQVESQGAQLEARTRELYACVYPRRQRLCRTFFMTPSEGIGITFFCLGIAPSPNIHASLRGC